MNERLGYPGYLFRTNTLPVYPILKPSTLCDKCPRSIIWWRQCGCGGMDTQGVRRISTHGKQTEPHDFTTHGRRIKRAALEKWSVNKKMTVLPSERGRSVIKLLLWEQEWLGTGNGCKWPASGWLLFLFLAQMEQVATNFQISQDREPPKESLGKRDHLVRTGMTSLFWVMYPS